MATEGAELIVGLVAPMGTNTTDLANAVENALSGCGYTVVVIKLSELLPAAPGPVGEPEDQRLRRLIAAGNAFCKRNDDDAAAIARLAINKILLTRLELFRQDDDKRPLEEMARVGRPRTAYILQSLKRADEVQLLREVYGGQFVLLGSQGTLDERVNSLLERKLSSAEDSEKREIIEKLIEIDADDQDPLGQNVNDTYPQADFFLHNNDRDEIDRAIGLLFGAPVAPTVGEYAMYVARASRARSLAASRKVGATIVVGDAVVATGYNDVPFGQTPDVLTGEDTSERFKQENLRDTLRRLKAAGMLADTIEPDDEAVARAATALKGGELMSVIEYQRAVHAEAKAIDDATVRGISTVGGTLYVTTYPCHLCYKHALSARLARVEYIEPYPKSRAARMFAEGVEDPLVPFAGVAPRRYVELFDDRPAFVSDPCGRFEPHDRRFAQPLLGRVREDEDRAEKERAAVNRLKEEFRL